MDTTRLPTRYRVIIPDASGTRALLLPSDSGWGLPEWTSHDPPQWEDVAQLNATVREMLGLNVATLRAAALDWTGNSRASYYLLDNLDPSWQPPDHARWMDASELRSLPLRSAREREVVERWFDDRPPANRAPWYRPGWFVEAGDWMLRELRRRGIQATGDIKQVRSWERSSVMRVQTSEGMIYFKAVPPQWGHEPGLTHYLGSRFPGIVPHVVAVNESARRMLVREFSGRPLPDVPDIAIWERAYATLARMQRELMGMLPDLDRLGVPSHRPEAIYPEIEAILHDERRMRVGLEGGLGESSVEQLQAAIPTLQEACRRLIDGPIPASLDHGDFWPGNIFASEDGVLLFDWSDATITHPFFSLVMAVDEVDGALPRIPGAGARVLDAYLREWTSYAPLDELRTIFSDAMLIAPLHLAQMYRNIYLPAMEFPDELDRMTAVFLKWLVEGLGARD